MGFKTFIQVSVPGRGEEGEGLLGGGGVSSL